MKVNYLKVYSVAVTAVLLFSTALLVTANFGPVAYRRSLLDVFGVRDNYPQTVTFLNTIKVYKNGVLLDVSHNVLTTDSGQGRDWLIGKFGNNGDVGEYVQWLAWSTDATAADTDGTCESEVTGSGLDRADGDYFYTAGDSFYLVNNTFTASGTVASIQKGCLWTASFATPGTEVFEGTFTLFGVDSGDTATLEWNVTVVGS